MSVYCVLDFISGKVSFIVWFLLVCIDKLLKGVLYLW